MDESEERDAERQQRLDNAPLEVPQNVAHDPSSSDVWKLESLFARLRHKKFGRPSLTSMVVHFSPTHSLTSIRHESYRVSEQGDAPMKQPGLDKRHRDKDGETALFARSTAMALRRAIALTPTLGTVLIS
jgi:hypothetical protein